MDRSTRTQRRAAPRAFELGDAVWLAIPGGFGALAGFSNLRILKREAEARAKLDAVDPALAADVNEENFAVPSYRYGLLSKRAAALQSGGPAAVEAEIEAQAAKDKRVRFARAGPEGSPEREAEQLRYMAEWSASREQKIGDGTLMGRTAAEWAKFAEDKQDTNADDEGADVGGGRFE
eukprot:PRCOL_00002695-RA